MNHKLQIDVDNGVSFIVRFDDEAKITRIFQLRVGHGFSEVSIEDLDKEHQELIISRILHDLFERDANA